MTMTELVCAQALLMVPDLETENQNMLKAMCRAAVITLENKLRNNLTTRDCHTEFLMAAALYAIAAMSEVTDLGQLEQITAGDLTLKKNNGTLAASCLRNHADMLMAPYLKRSVAFLGV